MQLPKTMGTSLIIKTSCPVKKRKNEPKSASESQTVCILCNISKDNIAKIA